MLTTLSKNVNAARSIPYYASNAFVGAKPVYVP